MSLRSLHRAVGLATLAAFVATGGYLRLAAHPERLADGPRLMHLSRHIYLLGAALVHLALAAYVAERPGRGARTVQRVGSGLLVLGSIALVLAFVVEAVGGRQRTPASSLGIYTLFAGVALHFALSLRARA